MSIRERVPFGELSQNIACDTNLAQEACYPIFEGLNLHMSKRYVLFFSPYAHELRDSLRSPDPV